MEGSTLQLVSFNHEERGTEYFYDWNFVLLEISVESVIFVKSMP